MHMTFTRPVCLVFTIASLSRDATESGRQGQTAQIMTMDDFFEANELLS